MKKILSSGLVAGAVAGLVWTTPSLQAGSCPASQAAASAGQVVYTSATTPESKDIVDTAVAAGSFKTLAVALQAGGLVEALKGDGPFTVFAPTDAAFAKLPPGTVETLLKPENKDKLVAILKYHVVAGKVPAAAVVKLDEAETLNGEKVMVKSGASGVQINNAKVVKADIATSNGIIHVIDTVLLPKG